MKWMFFLILCIFNLNSFAEEVMNQLRLEGIIRQIAEESKGEKGVVGFKYQGMDMYLISDVDHDRMRIITPVAQYSQLTEEQINKSMESNFHSALDARYATRKDVLYAAYIHPLSKLDEQQIKSAVTQVFNLRATFGSSYSSGVLRFGGN